MGSPLPLPPVAASLWLAAAAIAQAQSGWTQQVGLAPRARSWVSMAYDLARGTSVAFGGWANGSTPLGDTWEWNGAQWTQRLISGPPARCCYALAYDLGRSRIVLFGGTTGIGDFDDTWEYDGIAWLQPVPATRPVARRVTSMTFDAARSTVLLFGGMHIPANPALNDTWEWNGANWTQLLPAASPPPLFAHGMATDFARSQVVVYGGTPAGAFIPSGDTWVWNGTTWRQVVSAVRPPPMTGVALTYDTQSAMVLLSARAQVQETWLFDGAQWHRDPRAAVMHPRESCGLAYDWMRARTVLFGGLIQSSGAPLGDTWEYDSAMAAWTARRPGCPGAAGVPELRAAARPVLGTTFTLEVTNAGAGALVAIGFSEASWNGNPLPQSLATLGMPGCDLHIRPDVAFATVPAGLTARLDWPLPPAPSLAGITFFAQALVVSPGTNALGAVVSNSGRGTTGVF